MAGSGYGNLLIIQGEQRQAKFCSPSRAIHCSVAARGVEPALPTPIPSKTACVARTPRRCEERSCAIGRRQRGREARIQRQKDIEAERHINT